jgi:glutamyl-tRNA reductase
MKLILNNITYRNCHIQEREKVAFTSEQRNLMLKKMHAEPAINEAVILQTCNRIEFYLYAKKSFNYNEYLRRLIEQIRSEAVDVWLKYSTESTDLDAIRHLFEVAAGLDSQMLGENQILSQVKSAYSESIQSRMSKLIFNRLFHNAFRVGKAVRSQTHINCGAVSVALAAVELAKSKIDLSSSTAIVIGAGDNAELVTRYLLKSGLAHLIIANRNIEKARALASCLNKAQIIELNSVPEKLAEADLLISSTSAIEPVVTYEAVKNFLSDRKKPVLMIDLAVPRDIDTRLSQFEGVILINIDDLDEQININKEKRSSEIPKAKAIITEFTDKFIKWYDSLDVVPVISKLTQKGLQLAHNEAKRYAKDFGEDNSEKLRCFAESLVSKVLHGPISFIKNDGNEELSTKQLEGIELINKMFFSEDK